MQAATSVLVMEPASLAFIVLIRVWNQRVRQRIRSEFIDTTRYERLLSTKFQTEETIRVTSMFIPIVATKVFFTAFSAVSIFIANNLVAYQQADLATKMFLYEAFQQNYLSAERRHAAISHVQNRPAEQAICKAPSYSSRVHARLGRRR
ncbi:hypothetical protein AAVH_16457 [Aphelenchoides avenae]|nr:hypothetical protein AAVH_16457 [Aphelenchus avenae]